MLTTPPRPFEDLALGETIALGEVTLTKAMIIGFAREFDPLPFHLDEAAAKASLLGGLSASGWQTGALTLRLLVDRLLNTLDGAGLAGVTNLKWSKPVLVGDTIAGTATIAALNRPSDEPHHGHLVLAIAMHNQRQQPVLTMRLTSRVALRQPETIA